MSTPHADPRQLSRAGPAWLYVLLLVTGCAATSNPGAKQLSAERLAATAESTEPESASSTAPAVQEEALDERTAAGLKSEGPRAREPWEEFSLTVGALVAGVDSSVRFGGSGLGVDVSLEDTFGFGSGVLSPRVEGAWRYTENRRHRVALGWVDLSRNGDRVLRQDISLGNGVLLPAGSNVSTTFDIQLFRTEYSYSFLQDDRVDIAAAFGLYVMPISIELDASGIGATEESFDINAPLPTGGIRMDVLLAPKVFLRSHLNLFYIEFDDYTGSMVDTLAAFEWVPVKHFGIGFGYSAFNIDLSVDGSSSVPGIRSEGSIGFGYTGLALYLRGAL